MEGGGETQEQGKAGVDEGTQESYRSWAVPSPAGQRLEALVGAGGGKDLSCVCGLCMARVCGVGVCVCVYLLCGGVCVCVTICGVCYVYLIKDTSKLSVWAEY